MIRFRSGFAVREMSRGSVLHHNSRYDNQNYSGPFTFASQISMFKGYVFLIRGGYIFGISARMAFCMILETNE
jgi:hypothetical protein